MSASCVINWDYTFAVALPHVQSKFATLLLAFVLWSHLSDSSSSSFSPFSLAPLHFLLIQVKSISPTFLFSLWVFVIKFFFHFFSFFEMLCVGVSLFQNDFIIYLHLIFSLSLPYLLLARWASCVCVFFSWAFVCLHIFGGLLKYLHWRFYTTDFIKIIIVFVLIKLC